MKTCELSLRESKESSEDESEESRQRVAGGECDGVKGGHIT